MAIFIVAYLLFVGIHLLACKIGKNSRSTLETYISALIYDLIAPFSKLGTFIAVITKNGLFMMIQNFITLLMDFRILQVEFGLLVYGK